MSDVQEAMPNRGTILRSSFYSVLLSTAALLISVATVSWHVGFETGRHSSPVQGSLVAWTSSGTSQLSPSLLMMRDRPMLPASANHQLALDRALSAWRKTAPNLPIERPKLYDGISIACESLETIACSNPSANEIVISMLPEYQGVKFDLDTVLMHEIGHLLGVPHIEGDALMNAAYGGKIESPTVEAVALAWLHKSQKKK